MTRLLVQSFALAIVLTWPAAARFGSEAVGSIEGDGVKHLWTLWWMRHEVWGGTAGLLTRAVNFPDGMALFPIEPLNGVAAALLPLAPVPLSNLLAVVHVTLLGLCAGWLGQLVSGRALGGHVAGALAQGCAFTAFTLHVGVGELRQFWWVPLGLACLVKARETAEWRWFLALAGALTGATLSCFYHGFFLATAVSLYALVTLRPRLLPGYVLAAGLSLAVVVPVIRTFSASYAPAEARPSVPFSAWMSARFDIPTYQAASADPLELVRSRAPLRATADRQTLAYTGGRYLGVATLLLAVIGVVAAPRRALPWVAVAAGGALLSFGTVLWWDGALVTPRVVLPLAYLNRALSFVAEPMNFPARFVSVTMIALSVLGALATRWRWTAVLAPLAVLDMAAHDLVPWPRATFALPEMRGLVAPEGAVADLTAVVRAGGAAPDGGGDIGGSILAHIDPESRTRGIAAQLAFDRPVQTVPLERADHWAAGGLLWIAALPLSGALTGANVPSEDLRASVWLLHDRGFGAVMLTHACDGQADATAGRVLDRWLGERVRAPCATLWPIAAVTASEAESTAWTLAQDQRDAALVPPRMGVQFPSPSR